MQLTGVRFPANALTFIYMSELYSVGGIVVSIAASQAVDPGSIPGQCNVLLIQFSGTGLLIIGGFSGQGQSKPCSCKVKL